MYISSFNNIIYIIFICEDFLQEISKVKRSNTHSIIAINDHCVRFYINVDVTVYIKSTISSQTKYESYSYE